MEPEFLIAQSVLMIITQTGIAMPKAIQCIALLASNHTIKIKNTPQDFQRRSDAPLARSMVLQGAEILLYPTAIGGEPETDGFDSSDMWQRAMIGHSAQNQVPVIASNRIGTEQGIDNSNYFYGRSFITNHVGDKIAEADRETQQVLIGELDLKEAETLRNVWGIFRDRRPDLYSTLMSVDG